MPPGRLAARRWPFTVLTVFLRHLDRHCRDTQHCALAAPCLPGAHCSIAIEPACCPCPQFYPVGPIGLSAYCSQSFSHFWGSNRLDQGVSDGSCSTRLHPAAGILVCQKLAPVPPSCCPAFSRSGSYTVHSKYYGPMGGIQHDRASPAFDGDNMLPCKSPSLIQPRLRPFWLRCLHDTINNKKGHSRRPQL